MTIIDDLNDDEYDITWGGKRTRFIYTCTVQSDLFSSMDDSDETESILSIQSKSTGNNWCYLSPMVEINP